MMAIDPNSTRVDALMTRALVTVTPDTPIQLAAGRMLSARITGMPVVDHAGAPVGVLSLRDVLTALGTATTQAADTPTLYYGTLRLEDRGAAITARGHELEGSAADWMSDVVLVCHGGDSVASAARSMARRGVHRLLVVDHGELIGLLSALDIVAFIGRQDPEPRPTHEFTRVTQ
jgi:CBS domain-containing protein